MLSVLCWMFFMLSLRIKPIMLSVIMLKVFMLSEIMRKNVKLSVIVLSVVVPFLPFKPISALSNICKLAQ
jgi:hypothetical protein